MIDAKEENTTASGQGWRKHVVVLSTDSHATRIAALEDDIEKLRQALSRILPTIEELETWIGD